MSQSSGTASSSHAESSGGETAGETTDGQAESGDDNQTLSEVKQNTLTARVKRKCSLTGELFHRYSFIRLFATGPRDPDQNPHKLYCRLCKRKFSFRTKGIELKKNQFKSARHFPLDQGYRLANFLPVPGKDYQEITGK